MIIQAAIEVKGSDIIVDLDGSSPQVNWGGNVVFNFTYAYVFMAVKSMFAPDIPNNDGCARPIQLTSPGRLRAELQVSGCCGSTDWVIGHFLTEVIYRALSGVLPRKVIAGSGGTPAAMNVFYGRRKDGKPWHSVIIRGGGMGASAANDGNYVYIFPANGANTPVEIFESDTPLDRGKERTSCRFGWPWENEGGSREKGAFQGA